MKRHLLLSLLLILSCNIHAMDSESNQEMSRKQYTVAIEQFKKLANSNSTMRAKGWLNRFWRQLNEDEKNTVTQIAENKQLLSSTIVALKHQDQKNVEEQNTKETESALKTSSEKTDKPQPTEKMQEPDEVDVATPANDPVATARQHLQNNDFENLAALFNSSDLSETEKNSVLNDVNFNQFNQLTTLVSNNNSGQLDNMRLLLNQIINFRRESLINSLITAESAKRIIQLWTSRVQYLNGAKHDSDIVNALSKNTHVIQLLTQSNNPEAQNLLQRIQPKLQNSNSNNYPQLNSQPQPHYNAQLDGVAAANEELLNRMRAAIIAGTQPVLQLWNNEFNNHENRNLRLNALHIIADSGAAVEQLRQLRNNEAAETLLTLIASLQTQPNNNPQHNIQPQAPIPNLYPDFGAPQDPNPDNNGPANITEWNVPRWAQMALCVGIITTTGWLWHKYTTFKRQKQNKAPLPESSSAPATRQARRARG